MSSKRAAVLAALSFALTAGAALGPAASDAWAQQPKKRLTKKQREQQKKDEAARKEQERKDAEAAAAAAAAEEERKKAGATPPAATKPAPAPPPPVAAPAPDVKKEWDDSVEADKAVYFSAELAFTRSDLATFVDTTAFDRTAANGVLFGLAGGYRRKNLRFGLRWRSYDTTEFTLWSFALSAGYAMPIRPLTPIFSAHLGYVFDQGLESGLFKTSLPEGTILPPHVRVKGVIAGADAAASYWVTQWFRAGPFIGFDLMFLSREKSPLPQSTFVNAEDVADRPLFRESGFGVGVNFNIGIRGAFDIGIE